MQRWITKFLCSRNICSGSQWGKMPPRDIYQYLEISVSVLHWWGGVVSATGIYLIKAKDAARSFPYGAAATDAAKSLQLCPTLYDPVDCSLPGSSVHGILQARTLAWVVISLFNAWKWKVKVKSFSHVWLVATPWTAGYQAPPSMGFSRQEYWSEVLLPSLPVFQAGSLPLNHQESPNILIN